MDTTRPQLEPETRLPGASRAGAHAPPSRLRPPSDAWLLRTLAELRREARFAPAATSFPRGSRNP